MKRTVNKTRIPWSLDIISNISATAAEEEEEEVTTGSVGPARLLRGVRTFRLLDLEAPPSTSVTLSIVTSFTVTPLEIECTTACRKTREMFPSCKNISAVIPPSMTCEEEKVTSTCSACEGCEDGWAEGCVDGVDQGCVEGKDVEGMLVGLDEGLQVGPADGVWDGWRDGTMDGCLVG